MQAALAALLKDAAGKFSSVSTDTARLDAEILLAHTLGCARLALMTQDAAPSVEEIRSFECMASRYLAGEPIAYILGSQPFWNHDFFVNEHTLIPRQDTETLVEVALQHTPTGGNLLDLGTGTGCVLLSILDERPLLTGVGLDISADALNVAQRNAHALGLSERVTFLESNWFGALSEFEQRFDVIVSNPPYIPSDDIEILQANVKDREPALALDGGADGLLAYRQIIETAPNFLRAGGLLAVEVGILQSNDVADLFKDAELKNVQITCDLPGVERVVSGKKATN